MKKKIAFIFTMILCITFAFSGCDLFALDYNKYLAQNVATIGYSGSTGTAHTITITKEDLMQAYNRYGNTLQENGKTGEAAITYLVDYLINQRVILNEVEDLVADGVLLTTQADKNKTYNEIWENTYDSVINLLGDYEENVITDRGLNVPSSLGSEEEDSTVEFKPYEKQAEILKGTDNNWYIHLIDNSVDAPITHTYTEDEGTIITEINQAVTDKIGTNKVLIEAQKRYISSLKDYEKGRNLSTINSEVFNREILRLYNQMKDNAYIGLYSDYLAGEEDKSPITVNEVFDYLEGQMKASYTKYTMNLSSYKTDILSSRANVYYAIQNSDLAQPDSEFGEYFYVSHILIKFSDEQKTKISNLDEMLKNGVIDQNVYDYQRTQIINQTEVKGEGSCKGMTYANFMAELSNALSGKDDNAKMTTFRDYMYAYSEDNGNKNADFEYVVGTKDTKMVTTFTNVARELNEQGTFGNIMSTYDEYMSMPNSDVSSEYGIHIVFYIGEVENVFQITNSDLDAFSLTSASGDVLANNIQIIQNFKLSEFNTKTMFDLVYEKLTKDNMAYLEKLNLNVLKNGLDIKTYPQNYTDLF